MVLKSLKHNTAGRRERQDGIRRIGQVLMNIYANETDVLTYIERAEAGRRERRERKVVASRRIRRRLWMIFRCKRDALDELKRPRREQTVGCVEQWVDVVHESKGTNVQARVQHAMRCMIVYTRLVTRPRAEAKAADMREVKRKCHAKWLVCAALVRIYKQNKQEAVLDSRATQREGLVCASTRNVGRLAPKGGVTYDETRRHRTHIKDVEMYRTHRWPRRDKCGPTLVELLHHMWDVT